MRVLFLLFVLCNVFLLPVAAKTYSCRDSSGQLHFSDNLQGLPSECLGKEQEVKPGPIDNLQYVPGTKLSPKIKQDFQNTVRQADRELADKKKAAGVLKVRANKLLEEYRQLKKEMRYARRVWDDRSRQQLKVLKADLAALAEDKLTLQEELRSQRLLTQDQREIEAVLQQIDVE